MKAHECINVQLGTRGDREVMFRPGGIEVSSVLRATAPASNFGTIWMWHDEAVELRDALNRYLHTNEPEPAIMFIEDTGRKK